MDSLAPVVAIDGVKQLSFEAALLGETSLRSCLCGRWSPGKLFARPFGVFALSFPYGA